MYNKKKYGILKNQCAQVKARIGNELDGVDREARSLEGKWHMLRKKMLAALNYEVSLEQEEFQRLFETDGTIGLFCEADIEPVAMPLEILENNYPDKEFDEIIFADDGLVVMFDEDDLVDEDDVTYLCGPVFIVRMDEYGNVGSVDYESIKNILYYLDLNTVKMECPDDENLEYAVFRLE
ncbi:MAG: hypothetical protein Q4B26_13610 [Eubacteriales bacterium]|nr:hypothetical protein [Eubacteriales bacterium]